jgi:ATP-dependent Lhr-like helicase
VEVFVHHSAVSASERARAEAMFHGGESACIVCTSTLELGIDVGDLDRVVQIDAPATVSSFMQRMGRTGRRAGQVANTTFLCETTNETLQAMALVELARAGWVESVPVQTRCWAVCVHQLLAMALESGGVTFERAWAHLSRVPDMAGLGRGEVERLVAWMLQHDALVLVSGALVLGPDAERRFGRRHFMELFSVFTAPSTYTVQTGPDHAIGTLTQGFVDQLIAGESCFLLGGRAWALVHVHHSERRVVVEPAGAGRQPTWGGRLPQFLSREVCESIRAQLTRHDAPPYLDREATAALTERRELMAPVLAAGGLESAPGELTWWTFAGGRINATLRYAIESIEPGWRVIPDNLRLRIRGDGLTTETFEACRARLQQEELWRDEALWRRIAGGLPEYRISKFQPLMPPWVVQELLADFLLDIEGAWRWLSAQPQSSAAPAALLHESAPALRPATRDAARPLIWVDTRAALEEAVGALLLEQRVGLDVETTLKTRALCLIQVAGATTTYLIDALALPDLTPLARLLSAPDTLKLIHNASFERSVLGAHGLEISPVFDTLERSRATRGRSAEGGHSLKAVCARELGIALPKDEQTSDWTTRPLTPTQRDYAALDAELLLELLPLL